MMKRSFATLLVVGLYAGTATAAMAQNVTAGALGRIDGALGRIDGASAKK